MIGVYGRDACGSGSDAQSRISAEKSSPPGSTAQRRVESSRTEAGLGSRVACSGGGSLLLYVVRSDNNAVHRRLKGLAIVFLRVAATCSSLNFVVSTKPGRYIVRSAG